MNTSSTLLANARQAQDSAFWLGLAPEMQITEHPFAVAPVAEFSDDLNAQLALLLAEGYFHFPPVFAPALIEPMAKAIQAVIQAGFPPAFAFVYDAMWGAFARLSPFTSSLLNGTPLFSPADVWAWYVAPTSEARGWGPHRDLPDNDHVRTDGRPTYLTVWIPLSDAGPLNGCMYVLPTSRDPNYPNKLDERDVRVAALQDIRALPAQAGSVLGWDPRILHWGARSSNRAPGPRISIAAYLMAPDVHAGSGYPMATTTALPFTHRLAAIGAALSLFEGNPLGDGLVFDPVLHQICNPFRELLRAPATSAPVGRNAPCPCGSGRRYKACCGAVV
jgi:hypothetical protein